ncbi:hypothetical protein GCK72_002194 [Caenorhabditis remanei]|uniref:Uncharacterized protein n=1 Tax=Caenorhabditis remanei TaxID=31234 RepID=A0A6A5HUB8_CAERE|nr:hypothetical protein GCK72_002194 [Caenorhabditis remanei]KAF1770376.1 hypothetical protein GCK72_002194 [Caenorhabditis remanei]
MHVHKYGIVIHQRLRETTYKWKVAILTGSVSSHGCIDVLPDRFPFPQDVKPGVSVKAKFDDEQADDPSVVSLCSNHEWIRDVEVINSNAVIFIIVRFDAECLSRSFYQENTNIEYYIIQNDDTDLRRIAIPKVVLDAELAGRSPLQKRDEPLVYRVGVSWDPLLFEGGTRAHWRYFPDLPLVPIFELYYRDTTLPYLSESMTYGVLEGIVIAQNECGALYWTVGMGCAVLSNFTRATEMPPLGSVNFVLVKRCLPETSFGFPCCYELLPDIRNYSWEEKRFKIITDEKSGSVYIEAHCKCVPMTENWGQPFAMSVPYIGKIYRGLECYKDKICAGIEYYFRIEFRKFKNDGEMENECDSFVPVIVDLCLKEDEFIKCRVISISHELKTYFAVLEPTGEVFQRLKNKIDFVAIPFRVLHCAKSIYLEDEELMLDCFTVRIRLPMSDHKVADAIHVESSSRSQKNHTQLPRITQEIHLKLATLVERLKKLKNGTEKSPMKSEPTIDAFEMDGTKFSDSKMDNSGMNCSTPTIPYTEERPRNQEEWEIGRQSNDITRESSQFSGEVIITESFFASTAPSTTTFVQYPESYISTYNDRIAGEVVTESVFESSNSSFSCDSPKKAAIEVDKIGAYHPERRTPTRNSMFSYNMNPGSRPRGFGPSNYNHQGPTSPGKDNRRPRAIKFGSRQLRCRKNHKDVLEEMAYRFMATRLMFVENDRRAIESWSRKPTAKVTKTKKTLTFVIPIERIRTHQELDRRICRYTSLIRFVVLDKVMNVCDSSVVVPFGGDFPVVPKDFELGNRYKVEHFSFLGDNMCRFGGFAAGLNNYLFYLETPSTTLTNPRTIENKRGQEYVQLETIVSRPSTPVVHSEIFELWSCEHCPGYVLVELKPELREILETIDAKVYDQYTYSAIIEPLAGGPMEASILVEDEDQDGEMDVFVFWRLVVEFSSVVHLPKLISRGEKYIPKRDYSKREVGGIAVKDYGMWKTLHINSQLAQAKMDRLRALNDPRIRMIDGPDLKPELKERKVDEDKRRASMFEAMESFAESLPELQEKGMFQSVFIEDFKQEIEKLIPLDDGHHDHQKKKRIYSLEVGMNYITKILLTGSTYRIMNGFKEHVSLLRILAECIGLNATYIKKTDDVKKMVNRW